jgi:RNA-binding protein
MTTLKGFQKKYLRGLAHGLKPIILIGKEGITETVVRATEEGLSQHELIKIKFNEFKDKGQKVAFSGELIAGTGGALVGMIGHTVILYRSHADPAKRRIQLPVKENESKSLPLTSLSRSGG